MLQLCNNHKQGEEKEEHFWNKPLGAWIKDCIIGSDALLPEATWRMQAYHGRALQFSELCDGFVFSLLFVLVEPDTLNLIIMRDGQISDTADSLKRLSILLQNIRKFYRVSFLKKLLNNDNNNFLNEFISQCSIEGENFNKILIDKTRENKTQTKQLNKLIVMPLPDLLTIVRNPYPVVETIGEDEKEILCEMMIFDIRHRQNV
ncbi:hypothetical protein X798_03176 [Onchocerca flexuosa]|uniref:Uncharacterized protein n=1 Tax=Onchocerca flexuosa TaxID=387005 RepID=A0A238BWY0_9BILA|nr:hypothetical protein X798_03176 [Onchocerca flexuosa]